MHLEANIATNEKIIYVYDDFSHEQPTLMGTLYVDVQRRLESYSFEFDNEWLGLNQQLPILDPMLLPYPSRQFSNNGHIFGLFDNISPDK